MGKRKLNDEQIQQIKEMLGQGIPKKQISKNFGVSRITITAYAEHGSVKKYNDFLARKRGYASFSDYIKRSRKKYRRNFLEQNNFSSFHEYQDELATRKGYKDYNHMKRELRRKERIDGIIQAVIQSKLEMELTELQEL